MSELLLKTENITNPPEKMRLMFEAVSELVRSKRDIQTLKVEEITKKAGIGKGTAYEYFSSKEEIVAYALLYEYSNKIQVLVKSIFSCEAFKERIYRVMDWIKENREYHEMFVRAFQMMALSKNELPPLPLEEKPDKKPGEFAFEACQYIYHLVDRLMEDGYQEGAFMETAREKRGVAVLTSMCEYGVMLMGPEAHQYVFADDATLREFVYSSLIKSLGGIPT